MRISDAAYMYDRAICNAKSIDIRLIVNQQNFEARWKITATEAILFRVMSFQQTLTGCRMNASCLLLASDWRIHLRRDWWHVTLSKCRRRSLFAFSESSAEIDRILVSITFWLCRRAANTATYLFKQRHWYRICWGSFYSSFDEWMTQLVTCTRVPDLVICSWAPLSLKAKTASVASIFTPRTSFQATNARCAWTELKRQITMNNELTSIRTEGLFQNIYLIYYIDSEAGRMRGMSLSAMNVIIICSSFAQHLTFHRPILNNSTLPINQSIWFALRCYPRDRSHVKLFSLSIYSKFLHGKWCTKFILNK